MLIFHVKYTTASGYLTIQEYARKYLKMSLTAWRKIKQADSIMLNGSIAAAGNFLLPGDIISFNFPAINQLSPANGQLDIAYEDDSLMIVNKPAGLLVHPTSNQLEITLANYIIGHYHSQHENHAFHPVHRLDRNTSGLILIAKNPYIQQQLSKTLSGVFNRSYLALVHGKLEQDGTINEPIGRKKDSIIERLVTPDGQQAITNYKIVETFPTATLLSLSLETGRTHQIRVHLAHIGHPLLGDDLYGGKRDMINRHALHSAEISLLHPITHEKIQLKSSPPDDMLQVMKLLLLYKNTTNQLPFAGK